MKSVYLTGAALLVIGFGAIGCSNTAEGAKQDAAQDTSAVKTAADQAAQKTAEGTAAAAKATEQAAAKTGEAVDTAAKATEQAAAKTGQAVKEGADTAVKTTEQAAAKTGEAVKDSTKQATDALGLTPTVKAAILRNPAFTDVKSYDINVDSVNGDVLLKGWVSNAEQKKQAENIAKSAVVKAHSPNKVINQLTVKSQ